MFDINEQEHNTVEGVDEFNADDAVLPEFVQEFARTAYTLAMRYALHSAEFRPAPEGLLVAVQPGDQLLGARVYFEPPVKAVWVASNQAVSSASYDAGRQKESPLSATFYYFSGEDWDTFEDAFIYFPITAPQ